MIRRSERQLKRISTLAIMLTLIATDYTPVNAGNIQEIASGLHKKSDSFHESIGNGLCGAISVCTALHLLGSHATVQDFYSARFIGSCRGSTAEQIVSMLKHSGAAGTLVSGIGGWELRFLSGPLIASVRSRAASPEFDHWCVVIRDEQGIIMFADDGRPVRMTVAEFLGLWSGVGVVASMKDDNTLLHFQAARLIPFSAFFLVAAIAGLVRHFCRPETARMKTAALSVVPVCAVVLSGMLFFGDPLNHSAGLRAATAAFTGKSIHEVPLSEFIDIVESGTRLLVDARRRVDYEDGSISNAVSIPMNLSGVELRWLLDGVPRDTPIVVFCQSQACPYDRIVAEQLDAMSFDDVVVSVAGYREYTGFFAGEQEVH